jgi:hypothetical protein
LTNYIKPIAAAFVTAPGAMLGQSSNLAMQQQQQMAQVQHCCF